MLGGVRVGQLPVCPCRAGWLLVHAVQCTRCHGIRTGGSAGEEEGVELPTESTVQIGRALEPGRSCSHGSPASHQPFVLNKCFACDKVGSPVSFPPCREDLPKSTACLWILTYLLHHGDCCLKSLTGGLGLSTWKLLEKESGLGIF